MVLVLPLAAGNASSKEYYCSKDIVEYARKDSWPYGALQRVPHVRKNKYNQVSCQER